MQKATILTFVVFCLFYVFHAHAFRGDVHTSMYKEQPRWDATLDCVKIVQELRQTPVDSCVSMATYLAEQGKVIEFDNDVYLVTLTNGLKAVFKPGDDRFAEVAAYRACQFLKQHLVPPTVLRIIEGKQGSLQFFIETDSDLLRDPSPLKKVPLPILAQMKLFYFVFGQWDFNLGNQLVQANGDAHWLALIDNAGMANESQVRVGELPFVCVGYSCETDDPWEEPFPFESATTAKNLDLKTAHKRFGPYLKDRITTFWQRHKKQATYAIWRNALWVQYYNQHSNANPLPPLCSEKTLSAYASLTPAQLEACWKEGLSAQPRECRLLIKLTLERRNQLLSHYTPH